MGDGSDFGHQAWDPEGFSGETGRTHSFANGKRLSGKFRDARSGQRQTLLGFLEGFPSNGLHLDGPHIQFGISAVVPKRAVAHSTHNRPRHFAQGSCSHTAVVHVRRGNTKLTAPQNLP